jgi:uncharacterized protein YjeT (DUF2065 family)
MNVAWSDLLAALALMLVFEGLLPFLNPALWRRVIAQLANSPDGQLRFGGAVCMVLGLVLLSLAR